MKRYGLITILILSLSVLTFLTGCSYVSVQSHAYLGMPKFTPTNPGAIEILHAPPKQPCEKIGEITLEPQGGPKSEDIEKKLREEAAKMGADAVVIVSDSTRLMGQYVNGPWWDGQIYPDWGRLIVAVAIRYTKSGEQGQPNPDKGERPHNKVFKSGMA